jgi:hypothetical protein
MLGVTSLASAAELRDVTVELEEGRYFLRSETYFEAQRESLFRVLTNFDLFEKFTSAIVESSNVEPDEHGRPQFYARMEGCVLLFCKSFIRNGHVLTTPMTEIIAISDPENSDFKFSRERWELTTDDEGTLMIYEFEMEPAFWVPPVIGPYYIKRALRSGGANAIERIERLALINQAEFEDGHKKVVQSARDQ